MTNNTTNSSTEEFGVEKYWFLLGVFRTVVFFLIFVVNLATILTFAINRHLLRRSVYCLINLAVADMLYGLFRMIGCIMFLGQYDYGLIHKFTIFVTWSLLSISLLSLVVVSLDRVYATFFPFRHRTTRLRMYIAVFTITWLLPLPLVITMLRTFLNIIIYILTSVLILFLICLVIICTSYTAIFVQVKIQAKRLQPNQQQTAAVQRRQKREQHLAMTLFIVTVLSLITWLPFIICGKLLLFSLQYSYIFGYLLSFSDLLRDTNSLINPIVYVFRMRDFRKALKKLTFKCTRDQQHNNPISHYGNQDRQQQQPIELQEM